MSQLYLNLTPVDVSVCDANEAKYEAYKTKKEEYEEYKDS